MAEIWFSADWHLFHTNILHLGRGRPFADITTHNEALIEAHNALVGPQDTWYFLGDLSWRGPQATTAVLRRLNGAHKVWILGNHDAKMGKTPPAAVAEFFSSVGFLDKIRVGGTEIVLCHYPFAEWDRAHRGSWHLHGHQHGNAAPTTIPRLDVGVDCFGYAPVHFDQIAQIMSHRIWEPLSHH